MNASDSGPGRLTAWIAAGFLVRLALMPVGLHGDLLFIHYFPFFLSHRGIGDIYGFFGPHYLEQGFTYYGPGLYYGMALAQTLIRFAEGAFSPLMARFHEQLWSGSTDLRALFGAFSRSQTL